jgi:hypothetical protein
VSGAALRVNEGRISQDAAQAAITGGCSHSWPPDAPRWAGRTWPAGWRIGRTLKALATQASSGAPQPNPLLLIADDQIRTIGSVRREAAPNQQVGVGVPDGRQLEPNHGLAELQWTR